LKLSDKTGELANSNVSFILVRTILDRAFTFVKSILLFI